MLVRQHLINETAFELFTKRNIWASVMGCFVSPVSAAVILHVLVGMGFAFVLGWQMHTNCPRTVICGTDPPPPNPTPTPTHPTPTHTPPAPPPLPPTRSPTTTPHHHHPRHYLKQYWNIVNSNLTSKLQWNLKHNSYIFIQENAFENAIFHRAAILSRPQCVNGYQS